MINLISSNEAAYALFSPTDYENNLEDLISLPYAEATPIVRYTTTVGDAKSRLARLSKTFSAMTIPLPLQDHLYIKNLQDELDDHYDCLGELAGSTQLVLDESHSARSLLVFESTSSTIADVKMGWHNNRADRSLKKLYRLRTHAPHLKQVIASYTTDLPVTHVPDLHRKYEVLLRERGRMAGSLLSNYVRSPYFPKMDEPRALLEHIAYYYLDSKNIKTNNEGYATEAFDAWNSFGYILSFSHELLLEILQIEKDEKISISNCTKKKP